MTTDATAGAARPPQAPGTSARYRRAAEAADAELVLATMSQDVVLRSPLTTRFAFAGREQVERLLPAVFDTITDIRYFDDVGDDKTRALFYRAKVDGTEMEECTLLRFGDDGLIREVTLYVRPLPALVAVMSGIGAGLAPSAPRRAVAKVLTFPLVLATRFADWFGVKLLQLERAGVPRDADAQGA